MCPPDYYGAGKTYCAPVCAKRARAQWDLFYGWLVREAGAKVEVMDPVRECPRMVFTACGAYLEKRVCVLGRFRAPERRPEEAFFENCLRRKGYLIKKLEPPLSFEGQYDTVRVGDTLLIGYSRPAEMESHEAFAELFGTGFFSLDLANSGASHLRQCLAVLNCDSALIDSGSFERHARMILKEVIADPIWVTADESARGACQALVLDSLVALPEGCPATARELERRGFSVASLDFSEFLKAGMAAGALALRLSGPEVKK